MGSSSVTTGTYGHDVGSNSGFLRSTGSLCQTSESNSRDESSYYIIKISYSLQQRICTFIYISFTV